MTDTIGKVVRMALANATEVITPSASEVEAARRIALGLRELSKRHELDQTDAAARLSTLLSSSDMTVVLKILDGIAEGHGVAVHRVNDEELTTSQAAELLGMSRPTLVDLLEKGEMPYRMVGTHRRIRRRDVLAYRERTQRGRSAAAVERPREDRLRGLNEMAEYTESLGLGY